jgi:hypothetical protein
MVGRDPRAGLGPRHHEDPDRYIDGPEPGDVIPGTEYEAGGMYDPEPEPCPSACSVCAASGFPGCSPACEPCAAERAAYEAYLADTDHQCPREEFLNDPITVAYGVGAEMLHLVPCAVCDAREAGQP